MGADRPDKWKSVTLEEAHLSPYYGVSGWLLLLFVLNVWGVILIVVFTPAFGIVDAARLGITEEDTPPLSAALINLALFLPPLILVPLKHRWAPRIWIIAQWMALVLNVVFFPELYPSGSILISIFGSILITWYLMVSERVDVTFRHRVPADKNIADFPPVSPNRLRNRRIIYGALSAATVVFVVAVIAVLQPVATSEGEVVHTERGFYEAEKVLRPLAEKGVAESQYALGYLYDKGAGVPLDYSLAAKWYLEAARSGHRDAQNAIALMYLYGRGVEKNVEEAVGWFRKAAEQGNAIAQANLGDMYFEGVGVTKDIEEARRWYRRASDQGDGHGHLSLGWMYYAGLGVPERDYVEAYKLMRLAADRGAENAEANLALIAAQMTPTEILKADRLARIWAPQEE